MLIAGQAFQDYACITRAAAARPDCPGRPRPRPRPVRRPVKELADAFQDLAVGERLPDLEQLERRLEAVHLN